MKKTITIIGSGMMGSALLRSRLSKTATRCAW